MKLIFRERIRSDFKISKSILIFSIGSVVSDTRSVSSMFLDSSRFKLMADFIVSLRVLSVSVIFRCNG